MTTDSGLPRRTRSLTTTLALAFFSVSAFALLLSSGLQIALNIRIQQVALSSRQQLIARDAGKTVSSFIEDKFSSLETALDFANPINTPAAAQRTILESMLGLHPAYRQFALLDRRGNQLAQVSRASQVLSAQFIEHLKSGELTPLPSAKRYLSPIYIDDATSEPVVVIAIPVKSLLGEVQGTLVAEVNLKFMWDLVDQLKVGNTGYAYVVDAQGNLIAYRDTGLVLRGENVMQIGEVTQFVLSPNSLGDVTPDLVSYTGLNGSTVVGTYAPVGTPPWAVVIELPWREAYQSVITLGLQSLAIILVIAMLAGLVGGLGARRSTAPLVELSNVANEIAKGNMSSQASTSGPTEVSNLAVAFNSMTSQLRDLIGSLEERVSERTRDLERQTLELETISAVTLEISTIRNLDTLLAVSANLIRERFNYYHTGIYLFDERDEYATLQAASGAGTQQMLEQRFKLSIGELAPLGTTLRAARPYVAQDVRQDSVLGMNPLLPETIAQIIIPLRVLNVTIGALDIHSNNPAPVDQRDIRTLQLLGDQLAVAIENAQLVQQVEGTVAELNKAYRSQTQKVWQTTSGTRAVSSYEYDGRQVRPIPADLPAELMKKLEMGKSIVIKQSYEPGKKQPGSENTLLVPLMVLNQLIGVIGLEQQDGAHIWTDDEMAIAEAAANRAALSLENARLLEESQRRAVKESTISEATARIGSALNVENILDITAQELERVIGNSEIILQINTASRASTSKVSF